MAGGHYSEPVFSTEREAISPRLSKDQTRTATKTISNTRYDIYYSNCQALSQEKADLIAVGLSNKINVLCFCETWASRDSVRSINFENFNLVSHYCRSIQRGGGISVYCHKDICASPLDLSTMCIEREFEISGILIDDLDGIVSCAILTCYRSPGSNFKLFCDKIICVLDSLFKPPKRMQISLVGDFNIDHYRDSNDYIALRDILITYGISGNFVNEPTRGNNTLDHFYTSSTLVSLSVEDNNFANPNNKRPQSIMKRVFSDASMAAFSDGLFREDWISVYQETTAKIAFEYFYNLYCHYVDVHFRLKRITLRPKKNSWINPNVVESV